MATPFAPDGLAVDLTALTPAQLNAHAQTVLGTTGSLSVESLFDNAKLASISTSEASEIARSTDEGVFLTEEHLTTQMDIIAGDFQRAFSDWRKAMNDLAAVLGQKRIEQEKKLQGLRDEEPKAISARRDAAVADAERLLKETSNYDDLLKRAEKQSNEYTDLEKKNQSRPPRQLSPLLYAICLFLLSGLEAAANIETFARKADLFWAILFTAIVSLLVAIASHRHGLHMKQRKHLIILNDRSGRRWEWFLTHIASVCLLSALGLLLYFRNKLLLETLPEPTVSLALSFVMPVMSINLGIWFVGAVYSWWWHEELPGLREADRKLAATKREITRLKQGRYADDLRLANDIHKEDLNNNVIAKNAAEQLLGELQAKGSLLSTRISNERELQQQALERVLRKYGSTLASTLGKSVEQGMVHFRIGQKTIGPGEFAVQKFKVTLK